MANTQFRFDFCVPSNHDDGISADEKDSSTNQSAQHGAAADAVEETITTKTKQSSPIVFLKDVSSMLEKRYHQPIGFETLPLLDESSNADDTNVLVAPLLRAAQESKYLYEEEAVDATSSSVQRTIEKQQTDLLPGVYEGGLKVWECSIDLCRYLAKQWTQQQQGVDSSTNTIGSDLLQRGGGYVLELGCGHGLPGCLVLREGLLRRQQQQQQQPNNDNEDAPFCVLFTDYNEFVLRDVTLSNIVLNTQETTLDMVYQHLLLAAGDWMDLSQQLQSGTLSQQQVTKTSSEPSLPPNGRFDLILAAETTYTQQSAQETATLLARHLVLNTGVGLVATKRYYFGVGGGSDAFRQAAASQCVCLPNDDNFEGTVECHLSVETLEVYDNGAGNIRELLSVRLIRKS